MMQRPCPTRAQLERQTNQPITNCGAPAQKKKLVVDVRAKDDLELYYKTIPDYFEQDDGRKLTEVPDRTSTDMIEGTY